MKPLTKFFAVRSPEKVCIRAYELFLEELTVDEIVDRLSSEGYPEEDASRAVAFLPSAFARVRYQKEGIGFPERFYPGREAYERGETRPYVDEPIFRSAMRLAEQLERDGDQSNVWRFIEISAEHKGIDEARRKGLTPTSIGTLIYEF